MRLAEPVTINRHSFEPRVVGQTTLFPLEEELQQLMEATWQRGLHINRGASINDCVTGFIHDWVRYKHDDEFRGNADKVLSAFKFALAPYIDGLDLHEIGGFHPGPALMSYEAHHENVRYSVVFRISNASTYLIASPGLECILPASSTIKPALKFLDSDKVYERILGYVFRQKELDQEYVPHVDVHSAGYQFALKPVLVRDIPALSKEFSEAAERLERYSEAIHQAAFLISLARAGQDSIRGLEEKLAESSTLFTGPMKARQEKIYQDARELLDQVQIGNTEMLSKYSV